MSVDRDTLDALSEALTQLKVDPPGPIPVAALQSLSTLAKPGARLRIDLAASAHIGAPLVTLIEASHRDVLFAPLTARQKEVARLVVAGRSNKDIAERLGITLATVKDHVHAILGRLNVSSRVALIVAANSIGED